MAALTAERYDLRDQLAKMRARCQALEAELAAMGEAAYASRKSSEGQEAAMMAMRAQMAEASAALRKAQMDGERAVEAAQQQVRALQTAGPPKELLDGLRGELAGLKDQLAQAQAAGLANIALEQASYDTTKNLSLYSVDLNQ